MSMHVIEQNKKQTAFLVGVQTPRVPEGEVTSSLDELARLVKTLGFEVIGRTQQRRQGTGGAFVLGEGKVASLARLTGGKGTVAAAWVNPYAKTSKLKKAKAAEAEAGANDDEDDGEVEDVEGADQAQEAAGDSDTLEGLGGAKPSVVIFDLDLSPSQTRNLERALDCTVMDRTAVIIEIFSRHAKTRAARLQVEIAKLTYLAPRIRETGGGEDRGGGGVGGRGAGETALELDRRKIRDRIKELKGEFDSIEREHDTRRARRSDSRTVALVGYTNAGKSSMMRVMTGSEVYVADKLFATLDTTVRPIHPPVRPTVLVSDTVGFIKKLPHDLVASFKSTLDEAVSAGLLLYVVDSSDPSFRSQLEVTKTVLSEVGASDVPSKLVLNKSDRLTDEEKTALRTEFPDAYMVSTRSKEDIAMLREEVIKHFEGEMVDEDVFVPYSVQGAIGEVRQLMRVLDETYEAGGVKLRVRARKVDLARLRDKFVDLR